MKPLAGCPENSRLAAMLDETLPPVEQNTVQEHVDACPTCQTRLDALMSETDGAKFPFGELAEERNDTIGNPSNDARDVPLGFLEPSEDPGSLGRLGHYEVLEIVGRGGMGIVVKARDTRLQRVVAIKSLGPELAANSAARKRFLREARAAASISHDHIITIHAVEDGSVPYLVMEFIDGQTLQQKIDAAAQLDLVETLRIGHQIAAGLAAAHAQGLMHRDIKPANILLQNGIQRVQITDFGLARAVDDATITRTGEVTGTPQYMSPEQAQGQRVDVRSDLFSLGSVLYAMCTGRSPFRAESTMAVLRRVCDKAPRPISELNPEIPDWLSAIIGRLLEKDPEKRFQTAGEVAQLLGHHLARLQQTSPILPAAPTTELPTPLNQARGRRRIWLIVALVVAAVIGVLGVTEATNVTHLAGTVIRVVVGEGVVVVELNDPSVKVTVDGKEVVITEAGASEVRVRPGPHTVAATKEGKAVPVSQELVTIIRGGRETVKVTYEPVAQVDASQNSAQEAALGKTPLPAVSPFSAAQAKAHQEAWARYLSVPVEYTNSIGIKFRLIPPGVFTAGNSPQEVTEVLRLADSLKNVEDKNNLREMISSESPQHVVKVTQPIYLSAREITQRQYEQVMGHNPSFFSPSGEGKNLAGNDTSEYPVEMVSWNGATAFCSRLSSLEKLPPAYRWESNEVHIQSAAGYQLPTEATWEFACRAGSETRFWFGPTGENLPAIGWWTGNSELHSHPVAQLKPNPFGLYDILGNVSEWCEDGYDPKYYSQLLKQTATDPRGPSTPFSIRIIKGGNWSHSFLGCRSAARGAMGPKRQDSRVGLRLALPVDSVKLLISKQTPAKAAPP